MSQSPVVVVTGASGFIAGHIIQLLLKEGYKVKGTVRDPSNKRKTSHLVELASQFVQPSSEKEGEVDVSSVLEFVQADLADPVEKWIKVFEGADYVIHCASPLPAEQPNDENEVIEPAVNGTTHAYTAACSTSSVKRMIVTGSVASVGEGREKEFYKDYVFTEKDWSVITSETPPYQKSKVCAERALWELYEKFGSNQTSVTTEPMKEDGDQASAPESSTTEGGEEDETTKEEQESEQKTSTTTSGPTSETSCTRRVELCVILPSFVLGPLLQQHSVNASAELARSLLGREIPGVPNMNIPYVDVREVAEGHVNALKASAEKVDGKRFILSTGNVTFQEVAFMLADEFSVMGYSVPTAQLPYALVWFSSIFQPKLKAILPYIGIKIQINHESAKETLGVSFDIRARESILEMAHSLIAQGLVPKSPNYFPYHSRPFLCRASPRDPPVFIRSVEVGEKKKGEGRVRRNCLSKDQLATSDPEIETLGDIIAVNAERCPGDPCLGRRRLLKMHSEDKVINGVTKKWQYPEYSAYDWYNFKEVHEQVTHVGKGLRALGLNAGERLGIYEDSCHEWTVVAHACFAHAIVAVTVYANLGLDGLSVALNEGKLTHVFTNGKLLASLLKIIKDTPHLKTIIYNGDEVDEEAKNSLTEAGLQVISYNEVQSLGKKEENKKYERVKANAEDVAVIMYTSGSTGNPKGVLITSKNLLSFIEGVAPFVSLKKSDCYISYLPLAHVLALASELLFLVKGIKVGHANPRTLLDSTVRNCLGDLAALQPTIMAGVPTVWDRIRKGALAKIEKGGAMKKRLFERAYRAKAAALVQGKTTPFYDKLVFSNFGSVVGGKLRMMISGGAPLSAETHTFLRVCFGVPVLQGYGLTETCGGGTIQVPGEVSLNRSGAPILCSEVKLVDVPDMGYTSDDKPNPRGEICIKGDNVTLGYFLNEEKTKEDFVDGWFHTGDIGQWCEDGTLAIIDRKKNLVKLSHGEYIALEKLESIYKTSKFVEMICVYADSYQTYPIALVHPTQAAIEDWANENGIGDDAELFSNVELRKAILSDMQLVARKAGLKSFEVVKGIHLCEEEWTPENGFLTAAMKLKRIPLVAKFKPDIDAIYSSLQN